MEHGVCFHYREESTHWAITDENDKCAEVPGERAVHRNHQRSGGASFGEKNDIGTITDEKRQCVQLRQQRPWATTKESEGGGSRRRLRQPTRCGGPVP